MPKNQELVILGVLDEILGMPEDVTPTQIQLVGYPAESPDAGGQRPRPDFESLYFSGTWGEPLKHDPAVVASLEAAEMIQPEGPYPRRAAEIWALSHMFGLPE